MVMAAVGGGTPIVDGDRAAVRWSAQTKLRDGGTEDRPAAARGGRTGPNLNK